MVQFVRAGGEGTKCSAARAEGQFSRVETPVRVSGRAIEGLQRLAVPLPTAHELAGARSGACLGRKQVATTTDQRGKVR